MNNKHSQLPDGWNRACRFDEIMKRITELRRNVDYKGADKAYDYGYNRCLDDILDIISSVSQIHFLIGDVKDHVGKLIRQGKMFANPDDLVPIKRGDLENIYKIIEDHFAEIMEREVEEGDAIRRDK